MGNLGKTHSVTKTPLLFSFKTRFYNIAGPLFDELPYICCYILFMGGAPLLLELVNKVLTTESVNTYPTFLQLLGNLGILFIFSYIGAIIITLIKSKSVKLLIKVISYCIIILLYCISYFLRHNFHLEINNPICFVLLAETTGEESREFINQYIFSSTIFPTLKRLVILVVIVFVFEYVWCYIKRLLVNAKVALEKVFSVILIPIFLFSIYSTSIYWKVYNAPSPDHIRLMHPPKDLISSVYTSFLTLNMMNDNMETAIRLNKSVYESGLSYNTQTDSTNIVVVIGESYIKSHSQLYGYELKTTPNLCREENEGRLFVFNDVICSMNSTSVVMRNILCCNNSSDGEQWYDYPNFMTIFKQAGYNVYFWDNQLNDTPNAVWSFTLNSFLYNESMRKIAYTATNDSSYTYDEKIVSSYKERINIPKEKCNLILFHLMGQHMDYAGRFPHETFKHFTKDSIKRNDSYLNDEKKEIIADYDNATLYNDYVLSEIIDLFRDTNTILLYFSDHGEEVYDYRDKYGRSHEANSNNFKFQYDIPFMVWCSDTYKANKPEIVDNIKHAVNRPFITDNVCHMLFNVAGIKTPYYRDTLDLISPNYRCNERILHQNYKYEDIRYSLGN